MKYVLLMYTNETEGPKTPEENQAFAKAWTDFGREASASGAMQWGHGFEPVAKATTVRVRNGKTLTTDAPFAETHEQLGGVYLFECKDLEEAIRWAAKIPNAQYGSIEIRPLWTPKP